MKGISHAFAFLDAGLDFEAGFLEAGFPFDDGAALMTFVLVSDFALAFTAAVFAAA